jgi:ABC-type sugar transport system substrate-binding protein
MTFLSFAGKVEGDHEGQVQAVETCIASGAKGILITASDTKAIGPVLKQAREAGLLVIALDTPLDPIDAADATFATDNFKAGELIGAWGGREGCLPEHRGLPADRGCVAESGLHDRLWHRHQRHQEMG